jgi:hypothetical protein
MQIVDRRLNPKAKSLGNRQRFLRRAKAEIREAIKDSLKSRKVAEAEGAEKVTIRSKSLREPAFSLGRNSGQHDYVLPGNEEYKVGDEIPKPQGGGGGRGSQGSPDGEGQDEFTFTLTKEEFLDLFFDDLKLPNLIKVRLKDLKAPKLARAGYTSDGPPARLNRTRTMRKSLGRRMALRRPSEAEIETLEKELAAAEAETPADATKIAELRKRLEHKQRLRRTIAYIDPIDLAYNRFERVPKPTTQAVMFCLMDASASMTEPLKDLAKRFFMLLHVFLMRYYREVHIVFIRHTSTAAEVDEETFFRGTETGGTVISTALDDPTMKMAALSVATAARAWFPSAAGMFHETLYGGDVAERGGIPRGNVSPSREVGIQFCELLNPERAHDVRQAVVEPEKDHFVVPLACALPLPEQHLPSS